MLLIAASLGFLVVRPQAQGGTALIALARSPAAIQIDAVIEQPALLPLTIPHPARIVVVKPGQTVESLASLYGSDVAAIRWANGLAQAAEPAPGASLLLPPTPGALVRVRPGETPTTFATRLGVDPSVVLDYNALTSNAQLPAGSYLQLPLSGAPVGALIARRFVVASDGVPAVAANHGGDSFPYGQCTYYVATRRDVTWGGDAWTWWYGAAGIRPEGQVPVQGAIVVFDGGYAGHVAYVERVNPDGSFLVSEMNYYADGGGWGRVDFRTISPRDPLIMGFIY